jgi:gas vesicle protein
MEEKSGFGYFLLGLGIGVAAGILLAPRSGEETRQLISDKAGEGADYLRNRTEEGKDYLRHRADELKGSASDLYEKGRSTVIRQRENLTAAVEAGKQAYREAVNEVKSTSASATGTASASTDKG